MKSTQTDSRKTRDEGFRNGETTCCQLSKRVDSITIFAAEATAITLALEHYPHMRPLRHDVVVYPDSMCPISHRLLS